jgi:hypothetical protein
MNGELFGTVIASAIVMVGGLLKIFFQLGNIEGRLKRIEKWVDRHV